MSTASHISKKTSLMRIGIIIVILLLAIFITVLGVRFIAYAASINQVAVSEDTLILRQLPVPVPDYEVRWNTPAYADLADGEPACTIEAGSECQLIKAYTTEDYHLVFYNDQFLYLPLAALDLTGSGINYCFSSDQDMRTLTGFTGEELEFCLRGNMVGLGEAFAKAEQTYGVNALFMIAIAQHESGHGESGLAVNKNNLIGLRARNGWASFSSFEECVDYLGGYLINNYLQPDGGFYHGSTISGVSVTYCGGSGSWIRQIAKYMENNLELIEEGLDVQTTVAAQ